VLHSGAAGDARGPYCGSALRIVHAASGVTKRTMKIAALLRLKPKGLWLFSKESLKPPKRIFHIARCTLGIREFPSLGDSTSFDFA
jgi:hypothetical protein